MQIAQLFIVCACLRRLWGGGSERARALTLSASQNPLPERVLLFPAMYDAKPLYGLRNSDNYRAV